MNERKKDRDILDELLKEKHGPGVPGMEDLDKLTHRRLPPDHGAAPEMRRNEAAPPAESPAPPGQVPERPVITPPDADDQDIPFLFVTAPPQAAGPAPQPSPAARKAKSAQKRLVKAKPKDKSQGKSKGPAKKKTTHYLSRETFEELSQAKRAIRKLVPKDIKTGVSKSLIVDSALKLLLDDFEAKGEESVLVRKVLDAKDKS
jgi:hypothetical protein